MDNDDSRRAVSSWPCDHLTTLNVSKEHWRARGELFSAHTARRVQNISSVPIRHLIEFGRNPLPILLENPRELLSQPRFHRSHKLLELNLHHLFYLGRRDSSAQPESLPTFLSAELMIFEFFKVWSGAVSTPRPSWRVSQRWSLPCRIVSEFSDTRLRAGHTRLTAYLESHF